MRATRTVLGSAKEYHLNGRIRFWSGGSRAEPRQAPLLEVRIRSGPAHIRDAEPLGIPHNAAAPDPEDAPPLPVYRFEQGKIGGPALRQFAAAHGRRAARRRAAVNAAHIIPLGLNDYARVGRR